VWWQQQARGWLRAEVAARAKLLSSLDPTKAAAARQALAILRDLPALANVREPAALAGLPEAERREWQGFWREVENLLRASEPAG
jgi:hypothetical protein